MTIAGRSSAVSTTAATQQDLHAWLQRWAQRYPRLTDWVEAHIGETLNFYRLPHQHHKHLKSTNLLERLNEEIKRRTRVVRIFPNPASCLRLVRALCAETPERGGLKITATCIWTQGAEEGPAASRSLKNIDIDLSHDTEFAQLDVHNRPASHTAQRPGRHAVEQHHHER